MIKYVRSFFFWPFLVLSIIFLGIFLPLISAFHKDKEKFCSLAISLFSKILFLISGVPIELKGKENLNGIDKEKALIVVANHASFLDFFVLQARLPLLCRFVVWWVGFRMPLVKTIYKRAGYVGINERKQNLISSYQMYKSLMDKKKLVIFSRPSMGGEEKFEFNEEVIKLSSA
ncbi:MAG: lysophospholipid acyltransferase family protein, partial [Candidatus Margulisiibacteriota bacterium]